MFLKQSTATTLLLGPFVDSADASVETGLTLSQADILLWKEGGTTLAQKNDATACTHRSNGMYTCPVNTTDTNTLGTLEVSVAEAGTLLFTKRYLVLPANVYDSLVLGTDLMDINIAQYLGTAVPTADTAGYPKVTLKSGSGTGEISLSSGGVSLSGTGTADIADAVWDEATAGHVAAGSFGSASAIIRSNTAQAGASTTITLDASASAVDDFYNNQQIAIVSGTGVGQGRIIEDYDGTTKVATVASWATNPSSDSVFVIEPFGSIPGASAPTASEVADAVLDEALADHVSSGSLGQLLAAFKIRTATAQAGAAQSITLDASASATNDIYNFNHITILSGTGAGQTRQITDYVGSTKVATVNLAWAVNPSSDSVFVIIPGGLDASTVAAVADAVWDEARSGHATAGSFGEYVFADAVRVSGDSTAADQLESAFDGSVTSLPNLTIGTVSALTGHTAQSGDAFARLGAPAGASVSADVAAVKSDTAAILTDTGTTLDGKIDAIDTVVDAILVDTGTTLDGKINTVDTVVDAIKAKTDSLTFTVAGKADANITHVIADPVIASSTKETNWGGTP